MKILENIKLSKYTTVRIGGIADKMYIPENDEELSELILNENPKYFIGGGSNLLISDERHFDKVVNLRNFNNQIEVIESDDGMFLVGASVRLQKLINYINNKGFGGIEYLFSVPGLVGGAVYMNAGGAKSTGNTISDYIISVNVLYNGKPITLLKDQCKFSHRNSIFRENEGYIITSVLFQFPHQDLSISKKLISDRLSFSKSVHDISYPNFGSVFKEYNPYIMRFVRNTQHKNNKGVYFSSKTDNWIVNYSNGTYKMAVKKINKVRLIHRLLLQKCEPEVIIWE